MDEVDVDVLNYNIAVQQIENGYTLTVNTNWVNPKTYYFEFLEELREKLTQLVR